MSRGELIEIGGAFRMPDIMTRAGASCVEVGTTNRTHLEGLCGAIATDDRPHPQGPHLQLPHRGLHGRSRRARACRARARARRAARQRSRLRHARRSRALRPRARADGAEAVADGADLVTFSGDKLLGGPQAGFIVGRKDLIARINQQPDEAGAAARQDPARRARGDAAALSRSRPAGGAPADAAPARAPRRARSQHGRTAARAGRRSAARARTSAWRVAACASQIGSGALPLETLPSAGLAITPVAGAGSGRRARRRSPRRCAACPCR